ncbi:hypothetical protein OE88DRAFT_1392904 [Heliocybe sulcata]|uniref:G-protein coupled receptors family 1 profile domain-containing protein n=1 Tax=Heliocybe sulcata TaxID=5364 RepID=A0A5C3N8T8_9AGAM|nr:hypothetical protein OE88DRAFT_1392904 [Heliocybe sulcata]
MPAHPGPSDFEAAEKEPFTWTEQRQRTTTWISASTATASLVAVSVVLILIALLFRKQRTRLLLRRQSFRMLFAVIIASVPYAGMFLIETLLTGPSPWCSVSIFFGFLTENFINFLIMLLSINLQLVLVHGLRTEGFLKWYIGGSFCVSVIIVIPGTAMNVWGWDPVTGICYVRLTGAARRTAWQVGTAYFWTLLSTVVAFVCTVTVIVHLIARRSRRELVFSQSDTSRLNNENVFRSAAWRIVTYPIVMIIYNVISATADLSLDQSRGITTFSEYALWNTYGFIYGSLPLAFSLILIFVDPSFNVAIRELLKDPTTSGGDDSSGHSHLPNIRIHFSSSDAGTAEGGEELRDLSTLRPKGSLSDVKGQGDSRKFGKESFHHVHIPPASSKDPPAAPRISQDITVVRREFEERRRQTRRDLRARLQAQLEQM